MILKCISPHIKIDEISIFHEDKFIHFLTRPQLIQEQTFKWESSLYASALIIKLLKKTKKIDCFKRVRAFNPEKWYKIKLPDDSSVKVMLLETNSPSKNVMYIFKKQNRPNVLYTGEFTEYESIINNKIFQSHPIDVLYIDNTLLHRTDLPSNIELLKQSTKQLFHFMRENKLKKYILPLPCFGYEDFLVELAKTYNVKLNIPRLRYDLLEAQNLLLNIEFDLENVDIVIRHKPLTQTDIVKSNMNNIIPLKMSSKCKFPNKNLYQIEYLPNPTVADLNIFTKAINAKFVFPIFYQFERDFSTILKDK